MILSFFASRTRHKFLRICEVFLPEDLFKIIGNLWGLSAKKRTLASKQKGPDYGDQSINQNLALFNSFQELFSPRGAIIPVMGAKIPVMGANKLLTECKNYSLMGAISQVCTAMNGLPWETYHFNSNKNEFTMTKAMLKQQKDLELNNPISAFARAVPGSECHELTTHCNASVNRVNACNKSKLSRLSCTITPRHSRICSKRITRRVRDREPSRIPLGKIVHLLKMRKLRSKYKKVLRKIVPISSVLYSIATNYKQWKLKYIHRQDSFYSYYFMTTHKAIVT